jgi:hypothetical protein
MMPHGRRQCSGAVDAKSSATTLCVSPQRNSEIVNGKIKPTRDVIDAIVGWRTAFVGGASCGDRHTSSFRGAGESPRTRNLLRQEMNVTAQDSGLAPFGAPRNDGPTFSEGSLKLVKTPTATTRSASVAR